MPAFTGDWRVVSKDPVPAPLLALARKLVGGLIELGGVPTREWRLADGTRIHATLVGDVPKVVIEQAAATSTESPPPVTLWLPRGFLVRPASSAAPLGVGLPVVADTNAGPYDDPNLAPGLDFARWTAGGPLGEVLITPDDNAGYPADRYSIAAPLFYSELGPNPYASADADSAPLDLTPTWRAFRPSFVDFDNAFPDDILPLRRAMFTALNAYRAGAGVSVAYLMPRGFYRPAGGLSALLSQFGTTQSGYPAGYQSTDQRLLKDGGWSYTAQNYRELVALGGAPSNVLTAWESAHTADLQLAPADNAPVFADVGCNAGNWALALQPREHWLMAGRRSYAPQDAALPPISWDGPPSLNLGWLTWPIQYRNHTVYSPASLFHADGTFWLSFSTGTYGHRPAFGPHVYCRGRTLGTLPGTGFVLGAAIQTTANADRLVVIACMQADNAALNSATQGLTQVAHVYYADFPRGTGLRLHADGPATTLQPTGPNAVIDAQSVYWQDGGTVVLPGTRYISAWAFNADGSKALCLRDLSTAQDRVNEIAAKATSVAGSTTGQWWNVGCMDGAHDVGEAPQLVELALGSFPLGSPMLTTPACASVSSRKQDDTLPLAPASYPGQGTIPIAHSAVVPLAASYGSNGLPQIVYAAVAQLLLAGFMASTHPGPLAEVLGSTAYRYLGLGDLSAQYDSDLQMLTLYGCDVAVDGMDCNASPPQVLDVPTLTVLADGARCERALSYATGLVQASGTYNYALLAFNPAAPTEALNTGTPVHVVRLYRQGALVDESAYAHPYGQVFAYRSLFLNVPESTDPNVLPDGSDLIVRFPYTVSQFVQPYYAERFGQQMYGYQVGLAFPATDYVMPNNLPTGTDYLGASTTAAISAEMRTVVGGKVFTSFLAPNGGGDWISEAVTV